MFYHSLIPQGRRSITRVQDTGFHFWERVAGQLYVGAVDAPHSTDLGMVPEELVDLPHRLKCGLMCGVTVTSSARGRILVAVSGRSVSLFHPVWIRTVMARVMLVVRWGLQRSLRRMCQVFQLHEGAFARSVEPVVCLLRIGLAVAFPRPQSSHRRCASTESEESRLVGQRPAAGEPVHESTLVRI